MMMTMICQGEPCVFSKSLEIVFCFIAMACAVKESDGVGFCWRLENVGHVLDSMERVLETTKDRRQAAQLGRRLSSRLLDLSLCHVAGAFPLFAYRVWQLGDALCVDNHTDTVTPD